MICFVTNRVQSVALPDEAPKRLPPPVKIVAMPPLKHWLTKQEYMRLDGRRGFPLWRCEL
jgi:hypothetical protein